jgi:hypothetical protein
MHQRSRLVSSPDLRRDLLRRASWSKTEMPLALWDRICRAQLSQSTQDSLPKAIAGFAIGGDVLTIAVAAGSRTPDARSVTALHSLISEQPIALQPR